MNFWGCVILKIDELMNWWTCVILKVDELMNWWKKMMNWWTCVLWKNDELMNWWTCVILKLMNWWKLVELMKIWRKQRFSAFFGKILKAIAFSFYSIWTIFVRSFTGSAGKCVHWLTASLRLAARVTRAVSVSRNLNAVPVQHNSPEHRRLNGEFSSLRCTTRR